LNESDEESAHKRNYQALLSARRNMQRQVYLCDDIRVYFVNMCKHIQ